MITVVHLITGLVRGGAETTLMRLVTRTDPARFRSIVVSMLPPRRALRRAGAHGVEVHSLGMRLGPSSLAALPRLWALLARTVLTCSRPGSITRTCWGPWLARGATRNSSGTCGTPRWAALPESGRTAFWCGGWQDFRNSRRRSSRTRTQPRRLMPPQAISRTGGSMSRTATTSTSFGRAGRPDGASGPSWRFPATAFSSAISLGSIR